MDRLVNYPTSFLGTLCHIIAGLSVIAAFVWIVPAVVYFLPSVVVDLGNAAGLDLSGLVDAVQSSFVASPVLLVGGFVGFAVNYFAFKFAGDKLYAAGQSAGQQGTAPTGQQAETAQSDGTDYVRAFSNLSFFLGGLVGLFFFVVLLNPGLVPPQLFGVGEGQFLQLLFGLSAVYLLAGYGARNGSIEAVLAGTALFGIRLLMGLVTLNLLGLIVGGFGVYYGARSLLGGTLDWTVLAALQERGGQQQPGATQSGHQPQTQTGQQAQHGRQPQQGQPRQSAGQSQRGTHGQQSHQQRPPATQHGQQPRHGPQSQSSPQGQHGHQQRGNPPGQQAGGHGQHSTDQQDTSTRKQTDGTDTAADPERTAEHDSDDDQDTAATGDDEQPRDTE